MYRWVPWVSRATPFDRPNFGDPFVTPGQPAGDAAAPHRRRRSRSSPTARGTSRSADGLVTTWVATNVRDLVVNAAADYRTRSATVGDTSIRVITRPGTPSAAWMTPPSTP